MNLSVITINYNNREGLALTLGSVEKLKHLGFEYLVVDAESSDGSVQLIQNASFVDVKIIEKDRGIFDGMNKGVQFASNEFVHFLNSGEVLLEGISGVKLIQDIEYYTVRAHLNEKPYVSYARNGFPIHQGIVMRRRILVSNKFDMNFKVFGDLDLWYRLNYRAKSVSSVEICEMRLEGIGTAPEYLFYRIKDKLRLYKKHRRIRDLFSMLMMLILYLIFKVSGPKVYYNIIKLFL